jgi:hypothetical protein
MQYCVYLNGIDGDARQGRQQHAAQRVAQRDSIAAFERLYDEPAKCEIGARIDAFNSWLFNL